MELHVPDDATQCELSDQNGQNVTFGDLLRQQTAQTKRMLVIFIRHFFCGNCQEYVRCLSRDLSPSLLPHDLSVMIVGCGAPSLISSYVQLTSCPFPIYADPTTTLYKAMGMQRSLSLGSRGPAYIRHSLASGMVKSIVQGLKRIPTGDVMQAGHLDVNGGEFLLEKSENQLEDADIEWNVSWSHCMVNTRDHTEIDQLKDVLGIEESAGQQDHEQGNGSPSEGRSSQESRTSKKKAWISRAGNVRRSPSVNRTAVHVA